MDATIRDLAEYDYELHIRVSGVSHLSAAEAKYHSSCIVRVSRQKLKIKSGVDSESRYQLPRMELCKELGFAAAAGQASTG